MTSTCDICGDPVPDTAYACTRCAQPTVDGLRDAHRLAGEVETTVARLARYATRGGRRTAAVDDEREDRPVNRRMPVDAFGWPASKERPKRGALRATPLPVDLHASTRAAAAFNTVTTWARAVAEERGTDIPAEPAVHPVATAAWFLLERIDWIRHQPFAAEALNELAAAGATIRRVVDAPPEMVIVGVCDCGAHLYAHQGAATVTCSQCQARWDVETSREALREHLRGYLMTASEAAVFLAFFGVTGDRNRSRKTIVMWGQRGVIQAHGSVDGRPTYRFGDIIDRATRHVVEPVSR